MKFAAPSREFFNHYTLIESLEADRDEQREKSRLLDDKLRQTREGFSFFLHQSGQRLDISEDHRQDLEESRAESGIRINSLETELAGLREDFEAMENSYREKLRESEDVIVSYERKLGLVSRELEKKDYQIEDLEAAMELLIQENDELKDLNQSILGESNTLQALREKLDKANRQLERARHQKSEIQKETTSLLDEKERLLKESRQVSEVHSEQVRESERLRGEGMSASKKLDATLEQLRESEKRVAYQHLGTGPHPG